MDHELDAAQKQSARQLADNTAGGGLRIFRGVVSGGTGLAAEAVVDRRGEHCIGAAAVFGHRMLAAPARFDRCMAQLAATGDLFARRDSVGSGADAMADILAVNPECV